MSKPPTMDFTGPVPRDWLTRGAWLSEAAVVFATSDMASMQQMMNEGREAFTALRHGQTPEVFLLLTDRSRRDRARDLKGEELAAWRKYRAGLDALEVNLMGRLCLGTLIAFGEFARPGAGWEWIPVQCWMHLAVDPTTRNKVSGEAGAYWYVKVIDLAREDLSSAPKMVDSLPQTRSAPATEDQIRDAVRRVYDCSSDPPNKNDVYGPVLTQLEQGGLTATKRAIIAVAGEVEFRDKRRPPGVARGTKRKVRNSSQSSQREE